MSIDLKNIQFSYPDTADTRVLNIEHWAVADNERVFVHGPSGSGKSTLLNLLSGILLPSEGEVSILGKRLDKMSNSQRDQFRANHIGYVFQQFNLIPYLNAIENIELASHFVKGQKATLHDEIEQLLSTLHISSADWYKPSDKLSIGQQQRVAIARALVNKPQLLIVDEPTSALDQSNADNFMSVVLSLAEQHNITLIFVSHDMAMSQYFNRIDALADINRVSEG